MRKLIEFEINEKWYQFIKSDQFNGNIPDDIIKDDMIKAMDLTNEESTVLILSAVA